MLILSFSCFWRSSFDGVIDVSCVFIGLGAGATSSTVGGHESGPEGACVRAQKTVKNLANIVKSASKRRARRDIFVISAYYSSSGASPEKSRSGAQAGVSQDAIFMVSIFAPRPC